MTTPPKLHLVSNSNSYLVKVDGIKVHLNTSNKFLKNFDLLVLEDDTSLVLSADPNWRPIAEHPIRLMTSLIEEAPIKTGKILYKNNILKAVVHDLDREPTYQLSWIKSCYSEIFRTCQKNQSQHLALQLLGCFHGQGPIKPSLELFIQALIETPTEHLKTVSLIVNHKSYVEAKAHLLALSGA